MKGYGNPGSGMVRGVGRCTLVLLPIPPEEVATASKYLMVLVALHEEFDACARP